MSKKITISEIEIYNLQAKAHNYGMIKGILIGVFSIIIPYLIIFGI